MCRDNSLLLSPIYVQIGETAKCVLNGDGSPPVPNTIDTLKKLNSFIYFWPSLSVFYVVHSFIDTQSLWTNQGLVQTKVDSSGNSKG